MVNARCFVAGQILTALATAQLLITPHRPMNRQRTNRG
jgi:hypothetical protein